ncbi:MAG: 4-hydroxy-3-methylbut-2-enyl diphosphate reductase [Oscillospiraceae bacterium]|nr:4-hydroxy-3-methylbut-2-enyl diphosphate reductase [Oscillospiraceae bacterium]
MMTLNKDCSIVIADNAGFCSGVKRAMEIAAEAARKHGKAYTIGRLVHNHDAIRILERKNVFAAETFEELSELEENAVFVIRSHGVGQEVYDKLAGRTFYDATCPFVKKIHHIVSGDAPVIIAGDRAHPEVIGIAGHIKSEYDIVNSPSELETLLNINESFRHNAPIFVAQTTFNEYKWRDCIQIIKKHCTNAKIFDTICNATVERQSQARKLSQEIAESAGGIMVVIGSKHSSNSVKLYEICKENCNSTVFIENARDLNTADLKEMTRIPTRGACKIGITAGASVPAEIIKEVHSIMSMEIKSVGEFGSLETVTADETLSDGEIDFMAEVDKTFQKIYTGKRVKACVMSINNNEIVVDLGVKQSGYIPADEIGDAEVKLGDEIECIVTKVNDAEGFVHLSKKRIDSELGFEKLVAAYNEQTVLEGLVDSVVNSGVMVTFEGIKIFVPASQSGVPKSGNLETLLKKTVKFKLIEINEQRKRLVGSIRAASRLENDAAREKFWAEIEVGKKFVGEIKSMESYGVFVDLGGVDGMVHLSELTWARVRHPKEAVSIGEKLEVTVKSYDPEKRRVSLSAKDPEANPWTKFINEYSEGLAVKAKVVNITPFGAFAQIIPGIDGLIHISQISGDRIKNVSEKLQVGQEVDVQITEINPDQERVSISIKALLEPQPEPVVEEETVEEPSETEEAESVVEENSEIVEEETAEHTEELPEE